MRRPYYQVSGDVVEAQISQEPRTGETYYFCCGTLTGEAAARHRDKGCPRLRQPSADLGRVQMLLSIIQQAERTLDREGIPNLTAQDVATKAWRKLDALLDEE